jgi:hypothetical protein
MATFLFQRALQCVETSILRPPPDGRCGLDLSDVMLQHLEIVKTPQGVLRPLQGAHVRTGGSGSAIGGEFERVPKFLRGDPDAMQAIRRIHVTRFLHGRTEPARSLQQPCSERLTPGFGIAGRQRRADRAKSPAQLFGIHLIEPVQHQCAAAIPLEHHVCANIFEGVARDSRSSRQLIHNVKRNIKLPDRAKRPRQTPNLSPGFSGLRSLDARREDGDGLAQSSGGHASLVHASIVPPDGCGQKSLQRACSPCQ